MSPDEDYIKFFSDIWDHGTKDSPYKFAFGRFLVEYCKQQNPNLHVSFASIAEYFLKYYWPQVCRSNLKHNGHGDTMPVIVKCIKKNFTKLIISIQKLFNTQLKIVNKKGKNQ